MIRAYIALADFAELDTGTRKVHILGAGWTFTALTASAHAVVVFLKIPPDRVGGPLPITLRLLSKAGEVVEQPGHGGPQRLEINGQLQLQEPDEEQAVDLDAILPVNLGQLTLQAGVYTWIAEVEGKEVASTDFVVRAEA
jgi:hypothetical protein